MWGKLHIRIALSLFTCKFISSPDSSLKSCSVLRPALPRRGVWMAWCRILVTGLFFSDSIFPLEQGALGSHYQHANWNSWNLGQRWLELLQNSVKKASGNLLWSNGLGCAYVFSSLFLSIASLPAIPPPHPSVLCSIYVWPRGRQM